MEKKLTKEDLEWFRKHVDPHIVDLIIKINRLPFIETVWGCGGRILLDKCRLYHSGIIFLIDKNSKDGKRFIKELRKLIKKYKFVHLSFLFDSSGDFEYRLAVDKLEYPELKNKDKKEVKAFLENAFNETYGKLNTDLEIFIDKWLSKI